MNIMNTSKELEQWSKNHKQIADLPFELLNIRHGKLWI